MNIQEFDAKFTGIKQADKIEITCEHEQCNDPIKSIGMGAARRNILKNGGTKFVCGTCDKRFNNPMNRKGKVTRNNLGVIKVVCNECKSQREMNGSCYYGPLTEPYTQTCLSCAQKGKTISEEQKAKISEKLAGRELTEEHKENIGLGIKASEAAMDNARKNLIPGIGGGWNKGLETPEEVRRKQSETMTGRQYSDEHKLNISEGRKRMLEETGGFTDEHREKIRQKTLEQYANGFNPHSHHLTGWHESPKAGLVYYRSSYEKKAYMLLDEMENIAKYEVEALKLNYQTPNDNSFSTFIVDIVAYGTDNVSKLIIEVKPRSWMTSLVNMAKIDALRECGSPYEVWDEQFLFGEVDTQKKIDQFVDWIKSGASGSLDNISPEVIETRRFKARLKQKRYFEAKLSDKVIVDCEFCKKEHEVRKISYDKSIERNGRYICVVELGHIGGSKPKLTLRKENPYAAEGKKECMGCKQILLFEKFGLDKCRRDGYADKCKECRAKRAKEKYNS